MKVTLETLGKMKKYSHKDELKKEQLISLAERLVQHQTPSVWDTKEYGLIREIVTQATAIKKMMESEFLNDKTFVGEKIYDLDKELTKEFKQVFDPAKFLLAAETNFEIPKEFHTRFIQTVVRATRGPLEGEDTTKKSIGIVDDLKDVIPSTKWNEIDALKLSNTFKADKPSLKYIKIKKG